jgi:adenosylhomocysteinase
MNSSDLKDIKLAPAGKLKIEWAGTQMKVLAKIRDRFKIEKPLKGIRLGACLHVTAETANLIITLKEGGAEIALCGSNPLSTQDDVAASIFKDFGVPTFAVRGEDNTRYYDHLNSVLDTKPHVTTDDGADLVTLLHTKRKSQLKEIIGSSEETTTGIIRLKAMLDAGELKIPVMAVNDSKTKHMFDNRYGTGQSTVDGILRATNILLAGKKFIVCGYGWCGRGLASRACGMGADVVITEIDPVKALEAVMDGYEVMPLKKALGVADIIVTATGNKHVLGREHFNLLKEGAVVANTGHFNVEFDYDGLIKLAKKRRTLRPNLEEITLPSGKVIYALGEGRLINLVAAEGHPPDVMDMSFANQALAAEFFVKNRGNLEPKIYTIPEVMDSEIAMIKLETLGIGIDTLTKDQKNYLESWTEGT